MVDSKVIERLNELTAISRERELTLAEKSEREQLRNEYRKQFRAGFVKTLSSRKAIDENGNEVDLSKEKVS